MTIVTYRSDSDSTNIMTKMMMIYINLFKIKNKPIFTFKRSTLQQRVRLETTVESLLSTTREMKRFRDNVIIPMINHVIDAKP